MTQELVRRNELQARYDGYFEAGLKLDLTRGKPAAEQLDLSNELDGILEGFYLLQDGTDVRNYGGILGIPEARQLGADVLNVQANQIMVGGNSSLTLMYQFVNHKLKSWGEAGLKFLCPVPGYDRHFTICEQFGIEMIPVPLSSEGPDMDTIEDLVATDPLIKGIWCVPKYSNPTGQTYSDDVVARFARLPQIASQDFQIFWDNAYVVHDLVESGDKLANLFEAAEQAGTTDSIVILGSTSKITFAGAGISFLAASEAQLKDFEGYLSAQTIGFDKVNQLRHVRFLKDNDGIRAHMARHRAIIKPKFDLVLKKLEDNLADIATWTSPKGGYFISLDTNRSIASEVIAMAGDAGVKLTPAGATYPYGNDPENRNIRIAPTYPALDELTQAMDVFVTCAELVSLNDELDN